MSDFIYNLAAFHTGTQEAETKVELKNLSSIALSSHGELAMGGVKCHHLENLKNASGLDSYAFLYHHFINTSSLLVSSSSSTVTVSSAADSPTELDSTDLTERNDDTTNETIAECHRAKVV